MSEETEAAVAEFVEYWRANYRDGVVIGRAAWHEEKLARVVGRVVNVAILSALSRDKQPN